MGQIKNIKLHIVTDIKAQVRSRMVDTHDLFRKLGSGATFNLKRFRSDAEKFRVIPSTCHQDKLKHAEDVAEALDFFGTNKKKNLDSTAVDSQCNNEEEKTENVPGKKKKSKKRKNSCEIYSD